MDGEQWFYRNDEERTAIVEHLKLTPCPHCKVIGILIRHGVLVGFDEGSSRRSVRAKRIFCSYCHLRSGCGQTISVWFAEKIRRLSLTARTVWTFLKRAILGNGGNLAAAIRESNAPRLYRLFRRANLRRLRLLFEDFPKNHNLVLIGRTSLLADLDLGVNQDIKSRITYSAIAKRLGPDATREFLLRELDRVGLGHNTLTQAAIDLVVRSADGVLRKARNLGVGCLIEAVRSATRTVDIDIVNRVLMQPHW
ncbi:MAG: hypothetical protein U0798_19380 [Gemmataceae bacterium]